MKTMKKERTQREILDAAKEIIHTKGHESLTVRHLAEATGYSHTNLYYYFKDLNALLWNLRLDMIDDMIGELTSMSVQKDDPVEEVLEAFYSYSDYFFQHPSVFRFFYFYPFVQPEGDESYQNLESRFQGIWRKSFMRLINQGIIQPDELNIVAKTVIYALQGMIMLSFSSNGAAQAEDIRDELRKLVNFLFKLNK